MHVIPEWISTSSYVWDDLNGNGLQDLGEPPLAGVRVHVYAMGVSQSVSTGFTDDQGRCRLLFKGIPGQYWLWFDAPSGYGFTRTKSGRNAFNDSDPGPDGRTAPFFTSGLVKHVDAGMVRTQFTSGARPATT